MDERKKLWGNWHLPNAARAMESDLEQAAKTGGAQGIGQTIGAGVKGGVNLGMAAARDAAVGTAGAILENPVSQGLFDMGKGFRGGLIGEAHAATPPSPAPATVAAASPAAPAASAAAREMGRIGREVNASLDRPAGQTAASQPAASQAVARKPATQAPTAQAQAQPETVRLAENVYRHAPGVYSDGTGQAKPTAYRPGGLYGGDGISSGAVAAQRTADIYRSMVAGQANAGGVQVPQVLHSGNSWTAANELRNARVSANSITNQGRFAGRGQQQSPAQQEYAALLARDAEARKAGFGLQQEGMRQAGNIQQEGIRQAGNLQQEQARQVGGLQREALSQSGANYRADQDAALQARSQAETERNGALQRQQAELNLGQARALDALRRAEANAKTPQEQAEFRRQWLALAGNIAQEANPRDSIIVAGGGQEWDAQAGTLRQLPQQLYDTRTSSWLQPSNQSSIPPGMRQVGTSNGLPVYEDAQGKRHIWSPGGLG